MKIHQRSLSSLNATATTSFILCVVGIAVSLHFDVQGGNYNNVAQAVNLNDGYHVSDDEVFETSTAVIDLLVGGTNAALAGNTTNVVILTHPHFRSGQGVRVDASGVSAAHSVTIPPLHFKLLNASILFDDPGGVTNYITVVGRLVQGSYIRVDGANYTGIHLKYMLFLVFTETVILQDVTMVFSNNHIHLTNVTRAYAFSISDCQMILNHSRILFDNNSILYNINASLMDFSTFTIAGTTTLRVNDNATYTMRRTNVSAFCGSDSAGVPSDATATFFVMSSPANIIVETTTTDPSLVAYLSAEKNSMSVVMGGTQQNPLKTERAGFSILNGNSIRMNCSSSSGNGIFMTGNYYSVESLQYNWHNIESAMIYVLPLTPLTVSGNGAALVISSNHFVHYYNIGFAISLLLRGVMLTSMNVLEGSQILIDGNVFYNRVTSTVDPAVLTTKPAAQTHWIDMRGTINMNSKTTLQIEGNKFITKYSLSRHVPTTYMIRTSAVITIVEGSIVDITNNTMNVDVVQRVDDLPASFSFPFGVTCEVYGLWSTNTINMAHSSSITFTDNRILSMTKYPNISASVGIYVFAWVVTTYLFQIQTKDMTLNNNCSVIVDGNIMQIDHVGVVAQQYFIGFSLFSNTVTLNNKSTIVVAKNTQTESTEYSQEVVYMIVAAVYIADVNLRLNSGSKVIVRDTHLPPPHFNNEAANHSNFAHSGSLSMSSMLFSFTNGELLCNGQSVVSIENSSFVSYAPSGGALAMMKKKSNRWAIASKGVTFDNQWIKARNSTISITNCSFELFSIAVGYVFMFTSLELQDSANFVISGNHASNTRNDQNIVESEATPRVDAFDVRKVFVGVSKQMGIYKGSVMEVSLNTVSQSFTTAPVLQNGNTVSIFIEFQLSLDIGENVVTAVEYPEGQALRVHNNVFDSNVKHLYNSTVNIIRILARAIFASFGGQILLSTNSSISIRSNVVNLGMDVVDVAFSLHDYNTTSDTTTMNACKPIGEMCQVGVQFCTMTASLYPTLTLSPLSVLTVSNNTVAMVTMPHNESRYQPFIHSFSQVASAFFTTYNAIVAKEGGMLIDVRENNVSMVGISTTSLWIWIWAPQLNCTKTPIIAATNQMILQSNVVSMVLENPRSVAERGGGAFIMASDGMTLCGDPNASSPALLIDSNQFTIKITILETSYSSASSPLHWQIRGLSFFRMVQEEISINSSVPAERNQKHYYEEGSRSISKPSIMITSNTFSITSSPLLSNIPTVDCGLGTVLFCFKPLGMNATNNTQIRAIALSFNDRAISTLVHRNTMTVRLTNESTVPPSTTASYALAYYGIRLLSENTYNPSSSPHFSNLLVTHSAMSVEDYSTDPSRITPTTLSLTLDVHVPRNTLRNVTLVNVTYCGNYQVMSSRDVGGGGGYNSWEGLDDRPTMSHSISGIPQTENQAGVPLGEYFALSRCTQTESLSRTLSENNISISELRSKTTSLTPPTTSSTMTFSGTAQTPTHIPTSTHTYSLENTRTKRSLSFTAPPSTSTTLTNSISKHTETHKFSASDSLNETITASKKTETLTISSSITSSNSITVSHPTSSSSISPPTATDSGTMSSSFPSTETETLSGSVSGSGATASLCEYTDASYQPACELFNAIAVGGAVPSWPDSDASSTCGSAPSASSSFSYAATNTSSTTTPTSSSVPVASTLLHVAIPFSLWSGGRHVDVHLRVSPKLGGAVVPRGSITSNDGGSSSVFLPATPTLPGDDGEVESSIVAATKGRHGGLVGHGGAATLTIRVQFAGLPSLGQVVDTVWLPTHSVVRCPVNTSGKPVKEDYPDLTGTGPGFPLSSSLLVGVRVVFESAGPELSALQPTVTVAATISAVGSIASGMPSGLVRGGLASSLRGMMRCEEFDPTEEVNRMNNPFMMGVQGLGDTAEEKELLKYVRGSVAVGVSIFGVAAVMVTTIVLIQVKCIRSAGSWGGALTRMKMPSMWLPITLAVSGISTSNALVLLIYRPPDEDSTEHSTSRSLTQITIDAALSVMLLVPVLIVLIHYAYASTIGCRVVPAPLAAAESSTKKKSENNDDDQEMTLLGSSDDLSSSRSEEGESNPRHTACVSIRGRQSRRKRRVSITRNTTRKGKLIALLEFLLEPTHEPIIPPSSPYQLSQVNKNNKIRNNDLSSTSRMSLEDFEVWLQRNYFFVAEKRWVAYGAAEALVGVTVDFIGGIPITSRSLMSCAAPPAITALLLGILVVLLVWKWPFAVRLQQWGALSVNSLLLVATILVTTNIFVASVTLEEATSYIIMVISVIIAIFAFIDLIVLLLMVVPLLRVYLGLRPVSLGTSLARMRRDAHPTIAPPNPNAPRFELAMLFSDTNSSAGVSEDDAHFNKIAMQVLLHRLYQTSNGGSRAATHEPPTTLTAESTKHENSTDQILQ